MIQCTGSCGESDNTFSYLVVENKYKLINTWTAYVKIGIIETFRKNYNTSGFEKIKITEINGKQVIKMIEKSPSRVLPETRQQASQSI